jgi:ATPase subunit of ABC transporter with duplicated ATPase domains
VVVEATGLAKGYGDRLLIDDLSFSLPRGGIVGVIGANGAGKTTLFKLICGQEPPDGGELRLGPTVRLAYVDQERARLDPSHTVFEAVSGGLDHFQVGGRDMPTRPMSPPSGSRAPTSRSRSGRCPAASATGSTWP